MHPILLSTSIFYLAFRGLFSAWPFYFLGWLLAVGVFYYFKKQLPAHLRFFKTGWGLAVLSFLFWFSIAEIGLRISGKYSTAPELAEVPILHILVTSYESPYTTHDHNGLMVYTPNLPAGYNNYGCSEFQYPKATNSMGLMDREWKREKTKKHRFVFLGDSYTEGVGSPFDSSFVNHFERMAGDTIEMLNAGVGSSDPFYEYVLFEKRIADVYKPERIYITMNATDITDVMTRGGMERFQPDGTVQYKTAPWWEFAYAVSTICRAAIQALYQPDWMLLTKAQEAEEKKIAVLKLETLLDQFQQAGKARGIQVYFVFNPMPDDMQAGRLIETEPLLRYAQIKNYLTINLLQSFIQEGVNEKNRHLYFWPMNGHNKSEGYKLMAKGLLPSL